ncbi:unnamed protein product [Brassica napus]|uniref:(rape) hypothetical protein n=1 Tax=Brassica napus TaxID=3708 RepID=A0A816JYP1_BRANA|nr:unnamed protein product [Brassica napus]
MESLKKYMYLFIESTFPFLVLKICFNVSIFFQKLLNLLKKKLRVSFKGNKKDATEFLEEMNEKEATEMKEIMGLKGNGVLCVYPRGKNIKNMLSILKEKKKVHQRVQAGKDESEEEAVADKIDKSWLRFSLASPKLRESISASPMKGIYYCVIYLRPGDYHRIHSPADWNALVRRYFAGIWKQGFMALAADGATNIGSIEEQVYDPQGHGVKLEKGKGVGVFNMGSTVAVQAVPQITDSVESSNTTPQAAWQIAQPPASGTNPMDGATKGMDVDQPTPPSFGDEEKSRKHPWSDCWKYYKSSFPPTSLGSSPSTNQTLKSDDLAYRCFSSSAFVFGYDPSAPISLRKSYGQTSNSPILRIAKPKVRFSLIYRSSFFS